MHTTKFEWAHIGECRHKKVRVGTYRSVHTQRRLDVDDWESLEQIRDRYIPELREAMLKALGNDRERVSQLIFWNPMLRGEEWGPADLVTDESRGGATAQSNIASMAHLDTDILLFGVLLLLRSVIAPLHPPGSSNLGSERSGAGPRVAKRRSACATTLNPFSL